MTPINQTHTKENESITLEGEKLAKFIDHTKLTFSEGENELQSIEKLCAEARQYQFCAVCVRPRHVSQAKTLLMGSEVKVATVIGFPPEKVRLADEQNNPTVGQVNTAEKLAEVTATLKAGVDELDLVMNIGRFKQDRASDTMETLEELKAVCKAAEGRAVKVIIETDLLSEEEIVQATRWCVEAGAAMVKTSAGMIEGGQGATLAAVKLIRDTIENSGRPIEIKASGGIKNRTQAMNFISAGVHRLGTSSGIAIVSGGGGGSGGEY